MIKAFHIKEKGRYTVSTVKGNNVRTAHNTKAKITGVLKNGESIIYDGAFAVNGYRWITYLNNDLKRRYIATGEIDKKEIEQVVTESLLRYKFNESNNLVKFYTG